VKEYWEWRYGACIYTQQKKNNPLCGWLYGAERFLRSEYFFS
jgi:hypothetical protein